MSYWLVKSEPDEWSWQAHWAKRGRVEAWSGVRNHQANNHLKTMAKGDLAFFYHSGKPREIVGILEVVREWYPDPTDDSNKWGMVDMKAVEALPRAVTLAEIKDEPKLKDMTLVRHSRLSVMPVTAAQWKLICRIGGCQG